MAYQKLYTIKSIVKDSQENKATIKYNKGKNQKGFTGKRAIYFEDNQPIVLFKGVKLKVKFDPTGIAKEIKPAGIYDDRNKEKKEMIELRVENDHNSLNIEELKQDVLKEAPIPKAPVKIDGPVKHHKFDEIKACIEAEVPVYLYGPAGSGKNHVLQQIAEDLNLEFYFTNSVQQEYKITGFIDAGGNYHETEFYKAFKNGGLFFLDEMDASIPEVLILLNAALANGYFEFPNGKINAHKDFRVVSAGNTVGTGADEQYTGRLQLDQATLDRFAMIEFTYDRKIELAIAKGNEDLVHFINNLRQQAEEKGINATFSYRCISMVQKLENKLELKEVIKIAVVKGMDMDTINTFHTTAQNKYSKALWFLKNQKAK
jgi:cobaltochelatase CobS